MDNLFFSLNAVLPLFLLVLAGYILKRIGMFSDEWLKTANKFSFRITFSVLLFYDIYSSEKISSGYGRLIAFCVLGILIITALCYIIVPRMVKERPRAGVVIQGIFRSNFLLLGMPVAINMFGDEAKAPAAVSVAVVIPLFNVLATLTLTIFSEKSSRISVKSILKELAMNPLIIGCAAGFLFKVLALRLPIFLDRTFSDISDIAVPLALIILGGQFKVGGFLKNFKLVLATVLTKLAVIPIILITIAVMLGFRGVELAILITVFASPCAVSSSIMAYSMGCDGELAGEIVVLGTLLSVATLFSFIFILRTLAFL